MLIRNSGCKIMSDLKVIIFSICLLFILVSGCKDREITGDDTDNISKVTGTGIVLTDDTVMRIDPVIYSSIVTYIGKGEKIAILNRSLQKAWVGDGEDYWYKVKYSGGFLGWIYGRNIKIFAKDETGNIEDFLSRFWKEEIAKLKARLSGKWGSITREGILQDEYLLIYNDGKYKSFKKDSDVIQGNYSLNFQKSEIVFQNGTYFGPRISFHSTKEGFFLTKEVNKKEIKYKKLTSRIDDATATIEKDKSSGV